MNLGTRVFRKYNYDKAREEAIIHLASHVDLLIVGFEHQGKRFTFSVDLATVAALPENGSVHQHLRTPSEDPSIYETEKAQEELNSFLTP